MIVTTDASRAFGRGCDARLAGEPEGANPYGAETQLYRVWRRGWEHVDACWGLDARWRVRPLPAVREGVSP